MRRETDQLTSRWRGGSLGAVARFFLIGALLLVGRLVSGALDRPAPRPLAVEVDADATEAEVQRAVDEAILIEEGLRLGWLRTDPVIRRRLVRNMSFVDGSAGGPEELTAERERALYERALALEMHRTDPVVHRRMLDRARRLIDAGAGRAPTEAQLREHLEAHPERFARSPRLRLSQVFLSQQRRGEALERDAEAIAARLLADDVAPEEAHRLGDPFLHRPPPGRAVTVESLDQRFGRGFGQALRRASTGRWLGPIPSAYGLHHVWIHEVIPGELPPLDEVRQAVRQSLERDRRVEAVGEFLRRIRPRYEVRLERREEQR